jgi:hypothetical protein
MTSYRDVFGGSTVRPGDVSLRVLTLTAPTVFEWPTYATTTNFLARVMELSASIAGLAITLPDAELASVGQDVTLINRGAQSITVLNFAGAVVLTLAPGAAQYLYLKSTVTSAGLWGTLAFGTAPSQLDAAALAGAGLAARNGALVQTAEVVAIASSRSVAQGDRAKVLAWTGAAGTLTLLSAAATSEFFFEVRNNGSGLLALTAAAGETVDGGATLALQPGDSCFVHTATALAGSLTVGRGRSTNFAVTQLVKNVTGGALALTLSEATNIVQTFTGTLTAAQTITLPAVVQLYYVSNRTAGAFPLTLRASAGGLAATIPTNQSAILFCDGTDVTNASTTAAGTIASQFGAGSALNPSVAVGQGDVGLFLEGTNTLGLSAGGTRVVSVAAGVVSQNGTSIDAQLTATTDTAQLTISAPAAKARGVRLRTSGLNRWYFGTSTDAEVGVDAGADLDLNRFTDAGALIGTLLKFIRKTGLAKFFGSVETSGSLLVGGTLTATGDAQAPRFTSPTLAGFYVASDIGNGNPGLSFDGFDYLDYTRATDTFRMIQANAERIGVRPLTTRLSGTSIELADGAGSSVLDIQRTGAQSVVSHRSPSSNTVNYFSDAAPFNSKVIRWQHDNTGDFALQLLTDAYAAGAGFNAIRVKRNGSDSSRVLFGNSVVDDGTTGVQVDSLSIANMAYVDGGAFVGVVDIVGPGTSVLKFSLTNPPIAGNGLTVDAPNSRIYATRKCKLLITASLDANTTAGGGDQVRAYIFKNAGVVVSSHLLQLAASASARAGLTVSGVVELATGDYFSVLATLFASGCECRYIALQARELV